MLNLDTEYIYIFVEFDELKRFWKSSFSYFSRVIYFTKYTFCHKTEILIWIPIVEQLQKDFKNVNKTEHSDEWDFRNHISS